MVAEISTQLLDGQIEHDRFDIIGNIGQRAVHQHSALPSSAQQRTMPRKQKGHAPA
jgi:hypothetical protein